MRDTEGGGRGRGRGGGRGGEKVKHNNGFSCFKPQLRLMRGFSSPIPHVAPMS